MIRSFIFVKRHWNFSKFTLILLILLSITAIAKKANKLSQVPIERLAGTCSGSQANDRGCWDRLFKKTLADYGVDGALSLVAYAYDTTSAVGEGTCHDMTHFMGREAYKLFSRGVQFSVSEKTAYCNYGFFHGVIEGMTELKKPMSEAQKFCRYIDQAISKEAPEAIFQCYHGIGHGLANNHDPRTWGDEQAMLAPALKVCDQISVSREERWRCASGIFHSLAKFYREGSYKLSLRTSDPFWICREMPRDEYRETCFRELVYSLGPITGGDAIKAVALIDTIVEDNYAKEAMRTYSVPVKDGVSLCRKVPTRLYGSCIQSITRQLIQAGQPGDELVEARDFCGSTKLTTSEVEACLEFLFYWNSRWYPAEKAKMFCDTVNDINKGLCNDTIRKVSEEKPPAN